MWAMLVLPQGDSIGMVRGRDTFGVVANYQVILFSNMFGARSQLPVLIRAFGQIGCHNRMLVG